MVPDLAGADTRVDVTIPLSDLRAMDGASVIARDKLCARPDRKPSPSGLPGGVAHPVVVGEVVKPLLQVRVELVGRGRQ
jgi:hypothetical protein